MRARAATTFLAVIASTTLAFAAGEENREQGPHQHGHGSLEIAFEKSAVSMELRVPGNDIVGFEHAPKSDAEKSAVETASARLRDPLALFGIPAAAGCKVQDADVHMHGGKDDGHDHGDHKHDTTAPAGSTSKADDGHDHEAGHASFHVKYTLACSKPAAITQLAFTFFEAFPRAEEIEIVAISQKAQVKAEATRKSPRVSLQALW